MSTTIIGSIIFEGPLNGAKYLGFLQNDVEGFLEELPLNWIHFQQSGVA